MTTNNYFIHESSYIDDNVTIGIGTKIWHFCHVQSGAKLGSKCILGQNVNIGNNVIIGDNVKIQNNVSVYEGITIESDVFLGPSCVLTNVTNPRSQVLRHSLYEKTLIRRGATIGANATIVCGITLRAILFYRGRRRGHQRCSRLCLYRRRPGKAKRLDVASRPYLETRP